MKMRFLAVALFLLGIVCLAQQSSAQLTMTGVGGGFGAAASYTGPGDIQTFAFWGGWRCYSNAYSGNAVDVWDAATGSTIETLLTCSPGGTLNQTIHTLATTCASGCVVKTIYDQTGNGHDTTQATNSDRPNVVANAINSSYCMQGHTSGPPLLPGASAYTQSQPYSAVGISKFGTANYGVFSITDGSFGGFIVQYNNLATTLIFYAGGSVSATVTNAFHVWQVVFNGASGIYNIDGSDTTGQNFGSNSLTTSQTLGIYNGSGNGPSDAIVCEVGYVAGSISTGNRAALNTNMHAAYGGF